MATPDTTTMLRKLAMIDGVIAASVLPTATSKDPPVRLELRPLDGRWKRLFTHMLGVLDVAEPRFAGGERPKAMILHYDDVTVRVQVERDATFIIAMEKGHKQNKSIVKVCRKLGSSEPRKQSGRPRR
jgi:hypothetical protein